MLAAMDSKPPLSEKFGAAHVQLAGQLEYGEGVVWRGVWEYARVSRGVVIRFAALELLT